MLAKKTKGTILVLFAPILLVVNIMADFSLFVYPIAVLAGAVGIGEIMNINEYYNVIIVIFSVLYTCMAVDLIQSGKIFYASIIVVCGIIIGQKFIRAKLHRIST